MQDTVRINVEANINLWLTMRQRRNTIQVELSKNIVIASHTTFTLKHLNEHTRLVVSIRQESLSFFLAGTVVLRLMSVVITPPAVSRPSESGVTSKRSDSESVSLSESAPERIAFSWHLLYGSSKITILNCQHAHSKQYV